MNSPFFGPDEAPDRTAGMASAVTAPLHAVHLSDVQRVLALFTEGIAGHYLHLRPIEAAAADTGGQVHAEGATTDGNVIYLPASVGSFADARHNFGVYRIAVLHQLGFFENGTFSFSMARARERIPGLPAEKADAAATDRKGLARFFSLWDAPALMRRTFIMLEDLRIDNAIRRCYPGARADLDRTLAHSLAQRPDAGRLNPAAALWERLLQYTLGAPREELIAADKTGLLQAVLDAAEAVGSEEATVYDSARAAMVCYGALFKAGQGAEALEALFDPEGETPLAGEDGDISGDMSGRALNDDSINPAQVDFRGELNPEFVDDDFYGGSGDEMPENAEFAPAEPSQPPESGKRSLRRPRASFSSSDEENEGARSFLYDEWDYLHESYIKGWCRLFEHRLQGDDYDFIHEVHRRHATLSAQVKRRFKFIKPESLKRVRRVSDGEELELDGVIEAVTDRRAGYATDDRVYSRRDRAQREVAAAFLLDMSASTDYPLPDKNAAPAAPPPEDDGRDDYPMHLFDVVGRDPTPVTPAPPRRRVIDVARESLALMCEALGMLGDSHAIYGFSGQGRENVDFFVAKEFEDKLSSRTWAALAAMKAQRSTRMGPAIRHALTKLERQPARMKVLIVVSDGYPQDFDYGPDRTSDEYGIQDTARALEEAALQGVHTFCITIDPSGHDYLRRMCRENTYMVIDEVDDLPAELVKVYRALTV